MIARRWVVRGAVLGWLYPIGWLIIGSSFVPPCRVVCPTPCRIQIARLNDLSANKCAAPLWRYTYHILPIASRSARCCVSASSDSCHVDVWGPWLMSLCRSGHQRFKSRGRLVPWLISLRRHIASNDLASLVACRRLAVETHSGRVLPGEVAHNALARKGFNVGSATIAQLPNNRQHNRASQPSRSIINTHTHTITHTHTPHVPIPGFLSTALLVFRGQGPLTARW